MHPGREHLGFLPSISRVPNAFKPLQSFKCLSRYRMNTFGKISRVLLEMTAVYDQSDGAWISVIGSLTTMI